MHLRMLTAICAISLPVTTVANAQFKPAMPEGGCDAIIKLVNVQKLMERGQKDAVVMFDRFVLALKINSLLTTKITYASPGSELLQNELLRVINDVQFTSALVNGKPTDVTFYGAATFSIQEGKPQLRMFANQEPDDIAAGHDFIAPQPIRSTEKWKDVQATDLNAAMAFHKKGAVILSVSVDAAGNPTDVKVVSENPTGFNFGAATAKVRRQCKFVPGFRNGKPVACTVKIRHAFL